MNLAQIGLVLNSQKNQKYLEIHHLYNYDEERVLYWIEPGSAATIDDISLIAIIKYNNFPNSSTCSLGVCLVDLLR